MNIDKVIDEIDKFHGFSKEGNAACDFTIAALEELQQYRQIGTVDEFWALRPKIIAQKAINTDGKYVCPVCGRSADKYYDLYCSWCGQALKWDD